MKKLLYLLVMSMLICIPIGVIWFLGIRVYMAFAEGDTQMQVYFWLFFIFFASLGLIAIVLWLRKKKIISAKAEDRLTNAFIFPVIILIVLAGILQAFGILKLISNFFT